MSRFRLTSRWGRGWPVLACIVVEGCGGSASSGTSVGKDSDPDAGSAPSCMDGGCTGAMDSTREADATVDGSTADAIEDAAAEVRPDDAAETGAEGGPCGPGTCSGCCDDAGRCHAGQSLDICGINGGACADCYGVDAADCYMGAWLSCCRKAFGGVPPGTCACIVPRYCFNGDD